MANELTPSNSLSNSFSEMELPKRTSDLDEILEGTVGSSAATSAAQVSNKSYKLLSSFQNVSSFSMQEVFKRCPREYQWMKLEASIEHEVAESEEGNVDFAFGHAIGAAVAIYDQSQDINKARLAMFLAWSTDLFATDDYKRLPKNKSFHHAWIALDLYRRFYEEELPLDGYEMVAMEGTLAVNLEDSGNTGPKENRFDSSFDSYYTGHIDEIFKHKVHGSYLVKENKTAGEQIIDASKYSNSEQTTSYATVLDQLGAQAYDVMYTVYSTSAQKWVHFNFPKTKLAKVEWLQDQLYIADDIKRYADSNFFPKRGSACYRYFRQCKYYGTCDLDTEKVFGKQFKDLPLIREFEDLEVVEPYEYKIKLSDLVATLQHKEF